jgi:hypothetical protein
MSISQDDSVPIIDSSERVLRLTSCPLLTIPVEAAVAPWLSASEE